MALNKQNHKKYTRVRQVYAWIGFITVLVLVPALVALFIWAHVYLYQHGAL